MNRLVVAVLTLAGCAQVFGIPSVAPQDGSGSNMFAGRWVAVAAGYQHTCAIADDGTLWCWGENNEDELGLGDLNATTPEVDAPRQIGIDTDWASVSITYSTSCAIKRDGRLFCWGFNTDNRAVPGGSSSINAPTEVLAGTAWLAVAPGIYFTCGIRTDGTAWCWGDDNHGELGDGLGSTTPPAQMVEVAGGNTWTAISAGAEHACAIDTGEQLWCWGNNGSFAVGDPTNTSYVLAPTLVAGSSWVSVAAGGSHTCAVTGAAHLSCWGVNSEGELGNGSRSSAMAPTPVGTDEAIWTEVFANNEQTCAHDVTGKTYCWGDNLVGETFQPLTQSAETQPAVVTTGANPWGQLAMGYFHTCAIDSQRQLFCAGRAGRGQLGNGFGSRTTPVQVGTGKWQQVSAGADYVTCAIDAANALSCWGYNGYGQLADGGQAALRSTPAVVGTKTWSQVAVGGSHACAIDTSNAGYCWGDNARGQLGDGTENAQSAPHAISTSSVATWSTLVLGDMFTCGIDATTAFPYCWGDNSLGETGMTASASPRSLPAAVLAIAVTAITAGGSHACAEVSGELDCWGDDSDGALCNDMIEDSAAPTPVGAFTNETAGEYTTCALSGGEAVCCGRGTSGQLGDGMYASSSIAANVAGNNAWLMLSAAQLHTCGIDANSALWCWGDNTVGELGNGSFAPSNVPVQVMSTAQWASVSTGGGFTCGIQMDGTLWCWGDSEYGQLGIAAAWTNTPFQVP